jgi:hypothetical protein
MHDWQFPGIAGFGQADIGTTKVIAVAICRRCGEIRQQAITPGSGEAERLRLEGQCSEAGRTRSAEDVNVEDRLDQRADEDQPTPGALQEATPT